MSRWIDADAISADVHAWLDGADDDVVYIDRTELFDLIDEVPSITTKQVKYYDEDEKVWKIGEVIVDGEREGE